MDDRDEARVRGIPLGEFRTQQLHEALHRNIDTITAAAAKSAQWYHFMQTYLPKCLVVSGHQARWSPFLSARSEC